MEFGSGRKRGRYDASLNGNGGFKKSRPEVESLSSGIGSKSKPCTKFFSTSGCPFGEGCHFLHHVPGGFKAVSQMIGGNQPFPPPVRHTPAPPPLFTDGSSPPVVKNRLCNKFNSAEGCKFGDKCHYAHGDWELGKPTVPSSYEDHRHHQHQHYQNQHHQHQNQHQRGGPMQSRMGHGPPPPAHGPAASFGLSSTAKISVDASLAGAIIGKSGVNCKQICRVTGAKLSIRDNEDPSLRNVELEGTLDQINQASVMVREIIANISSGAGNQMRNNHHHHNHQGNHANPGSNFKTKSCDNFNKGSCTFGDRCHFAHGAEELRKAAM